MREKSLSVFKSTDNAVEIKRSIKYKKEPHAYLLTVDLYITLLKNDVFKVIT